MANSIRGLVLFFARRYPEVIVQCRNVPEFDPHFNMTFHFLGHTYRETGRYTEAMDMFVKAYGGSQDSLDMAQLYALIGRRDDAKALLAKAKLHGGVAANNPYDRAAVYTALGDTEAAFRELDTAYRNHSDWLPFLKVDPRMDRLRKDPRFLRLLRALGMKPLRA